MDPGFPDIVRQCAAEQIDDRAPVWIVERGSDGRLEERLDPSFPDALVDAPAVEDIVDALVVAAARQDIAETRIW